MRPTVVCSSDGAAPPLRYLLFKGYLHMITSRPFTPRTPDPAKAPRPPTQRPKARVQARQADTSSQQDQGCVPVGRQIVYGPSMRLSGTTERIVTPEN